MLLICSLTAVQAGYLIANFTQPLTSAVNIAQEVAFGNLTVDIDIDSDSLKGHCGV
ncbi:MAG TPA: hypothetical protein VGL07_12815 [Buttiauxella sp.]|jgi:nitrogen fixation/metabolism regulation signal transduction histidine kinase